ncbi:transmembrane protein 138 isoform X1 [Trichosurus vulpecula]|uniref:transmembrane protein 138 isoform X1 n=1 Tax=Trichosurus vulpecula TaxID=9337 RepID=UPI00186ADAC9|nr:transmembrane protein 138 isoform X1 [Trichosurus vulpecula]
MPPPGRALSTEDAADQQLQPGAGLAVRAAALRPVRERLLGAAARGARGPAGALHVSHLAPPHPAVCWCPLGPGARARARADQAPRSISCLCLHSIQDIAILFNVIIIFLMFFNTFVFQAGLVSLLFRKFKGTIILTALYLSLSIPLHVWVLNLRWKNSKHFIWTDGLQTLFVFQRLAAVLYGYFYKRTAIRLGDPRFYQDSLWLRKEFTQVRS